jgi:hypothetical protein
MKDTITFRRCDSHLTLIEGMERSKQAMIKEGLWHNNITLEEWAQYAGAHIIITPPDEVPH